MKSMYNVYEIAAAEILPYIIRIPYLKRWGNAMQVKQQGEQFLLYKEKQLVGQCVCRAQEEGFSVEELTVCEEWRGKGYASFLLKQVLRATGGFGTKSLHFMPVPESEAACALAKKFGFAPEQDRWVRRRTPDPTAVGLTHEFLKTHLRPGGFFVDATCGNGGDTAFLCRLAGESGRVLALDVQAQAVHNTNERLEKEGLAEIGKAVQLDHAELAQLVEPGTADCIVFNFGYLPGGDHALFTTPKSSLPAVKAALEALRPGGILAACLYSGGPNGHGEKQTMLAFLRSLPITQYTVLVCEFANWADTAPLPCFVLKKGA